MNFEVTALFFAVNVSQELSTSQLFRIVSLRICDVKIHIAFAFSMNQALESGVPGILIRHEEKLVDPSPPPLTL